MKRHIETDSRINASGIGHKKIVVRQDNSIASPVIDAEKRYAVITRQKISAKRHQTPIIIAREDTGVILS